MCVTEIYLIYFSCTVAQDGFGRIVEQGRSRVSSVSGAIDVLYAQRERMACSATSPPADATFRSSHHAFCARSSETRANDEAHIIVERVRVVKRLWTSIAGEISVSVEVAEISGRVVPRANRVALDEARLWAEGGILIELLRAICWIHIQDKVAVSDVTAWSVVRLKGDTAAEAEAGADSEAGRLHLGSRRRYLDADRGAIVSDVAISVAWGGGAERDGGADGDLQTMHQYTEKEARLSQLTGGPLTSEVVSYLAAIMSA